MSDILLDWDNHEGCAVSDLTDTAGLRSAIAISLFSDRRAGGIPTQDDRGWWGESYLEPGTVFGSLLWTRDRAKLGPDLAAEIKSDCMAALAWLTETGTAARLTVGVTIEVRNHVGRAEIAVSAERPSGDTEDLRYNLQFGLS